MKTVYEATHATEAHMIVDLLKQQGIPARIHGEYLQGAVGELPAGGGVRVVADEEDFAAARRVVMDWEGAQPPEAPEAPASSARKTRSQALQWLLAGLVAGIAVTSAAFRSPVRQEGIDHNRDGVLDERWTFSPSGRTVKVEIDRNLDGKIDHVAHYDALGLIETAESDDDFDGVFESRHAFSRGNASVSETDSDGDGFPDIRYRYRSGVLDTMEFLDPSSGRPLRVEHYKLGRLLSADIDKDKDGRLDTRQTYNATLEVVATTPIAQ